MYRYGLILLIFLFSVFQQRATEKDLWIFGKGASLKFDSPTSNPYSLSSDFLINSPEAAATGFDKDGNLLFYSDGVNVWNYENTVIYSSLQGNQDATQGITVFKPPSIDSLFYLVTQNISTFKKGSYIYKLDFRANPKGVVNINPEYLEFSNTSFERLEVVPHYNNQDFWIITNPHYENDSEYFVYLYDTSGVNLISRFESKHKRNFNEGYLKASPNGRYLVSADIDANSIEMVEFDNELGILKNAKIYKDPKLDAGVYGIEFSPNSRFLYLTIYQHLSGNKSKSLCLQLDFNSYYFANDDITHEVFNLVHEKNDGGMWGIKRAINGRIYIARNNLSYLSVISSPDNGGINCSFKELGPAITTNNDKCLRGLPSTAANSYISDYEIVDIKKCVGDFINYIPQANIDYSQYHWLGNNSIRNEKNLAIVDLEIDDSGIYYLTNKITNKVILAVRLRIGAKKEFEITAKPNSVVCGVDSILLKPNSKFEKYEWSTGEKDSVLWVKESGKYTLIATNEFGCTSENEIYVKFIKAPDFEIEVERLDCDNTYRLTCSEKFDNYLWSNYDTNRTTIVKNPKEYSLTVKYSEQCKTTKKVKLEDVSKNIELEFPNGLFICEDEIITVRLINRDKNCIYQWSNGSKADGTVYKNAGNEYIEATDTTTGCVFRREFEILSSKNFELVITPIYNCEDKSIKLTSNADYNSFNYYWGNGSTNSIIDAEAGKKYTLVVESKFKSCSYEAEILVEEFYSTKLELEYPNGNYICKDETIVVRVKNADNNANYLWSNGKNGSEIEITNPGQYSVKAINKLTNCEETVVFDIKSLFDFELVINEQFDCNTSTTLLSANADSKIFDFEWSNGFTSDSIFIKKAGKYTLKAITKNGCEFYDTITVERVRSFDLEISSYPSDTICSPGQVVLKLESISPKIVSKRWSTGSREDSIIVDKSGRYIIEANDKNYCYVRDTVFVEIIPPPVISINSKKGNEICEGEQTVLEVVGLDNISKYTYKWSNGTNSPTLVVSESGIYTVIVTPKGTDCADTASITINTLPTPELKLTGKTEFCEGSQSILRAEYKNGNILWGNGSTSDSIIVDKSGIYYATVTNSLGCTVADTIEVIEKALPKFTIEGDKYICFGESTVLTCSEDFTSYEWSNSSTEKSIEVSESGIYRLKVTNEFGCTNTVEIEVQKTEKSLDITNIELLKDSLLVGEVNELNFEILNKNNSSIQYKIESGDFTKTFNLQSNADSKITIPLNSNKLGKKTLEVKISIEGSCGTDTIFTVEYEVYTALKATLTKQYYPYIDEQVTYPVEFISTIPLELNLTYKLSLPESIFYTNQDVEFAENITINNKLTHNIDGLTLLGEPSKQPTYFEYITTDNPYVIIDTTNGSIEIGKICLNDLRMVTIELFDGISIYPNPASDILTLEIINDGEHEVSLEFIDMLGTKVYEINTLVSKSKDIDISKLSAGAYIVKLKSKNWEGIYKLNKIK